MSILLNQLQDYLSDLHRQNPGEFRTSSSEQRGRLTQGMVDRLGLSWTQEDRSTANWRQARHEAGHWLTTAEMGDAASYYLTAGDSPAVGRTSTAPNFLVSSSRSAFSLLSGAASESITEGMNEPFRHAGHISDIFAYNQQFSRDLSSYEQLTKEHVDFFYQGVQARMNDMLSLDETGAPTPQSQQRYDTMVSAAQAMYKTPFWVSNRAGQEDREYFARAAGVPVPEAGSGRIQMPEHVYNSTMSWVKQTGSPMASMFGQIVSPVAVPEEMLTFGRASRMAPIGHVEASQINNPLRAFRAMVAPQLNTYNSAARQGIAMGRRLGSQGPDSDIWRQISSQSGVPVSGVAAGVDPMNPQRTRTANVGGVLFGSQRGLQTTDEQGRSTAWRVRTVGGADARSIAAGKSSIPGESMIEAELSAHVAAQNNDSVGGYGSVIMNRDTGELVSAQGAGFDQGQISPELRQKIDTIRNMTAVSQGAFGLSGSDVGMRLADTGAGDAEGLGALDESIKMLSGQFADDEQVAQIFPGLERSDLALGLDSPAIRNALFLQGGSPAGNLLQQSVAGTGLASIAPSAAGGRGGLGGGSLGGGLLGGSGSGGQPPKSGNPSAAAAPPGGSGGGKKPARTDFGEYEKHVDALAEALPRLSKVMEDATKSTAKLTDQQTSYVQSASQLYKELQGAVGEAVQGGTPEGMAFAQKAMGAGFGSLGNMLHGAGDQQGLISRSFIDQFRRPVGETPPSLSDRLTPFSMRGRAGERAVQQGVESGWYGEEGSAERAAWMIGGRLSAIPSEIVHARYAMRTAQAEFLGPMEQARQTFLGAEGRMAQARLGIYGMGYAGSDEYASSVMPTILSENQQLAMGRQSQQAFGGILGLSNRIFGTQTGAQAQGLLQSALAGGTAGMPFGPIGSVLGTMAGGGLYAAGQMADYFDPHRSERRVAAHTAASTGDFGAVGLFDHAGMVADYAFGSVFGRTAQGQQRHDRERGAGMTVSNMIRSPEQMGGQIIGLGMADPTISRQFVSSALRSDNWLGGSGTFLKDEDRQRLGEQVYGMMGGAWGVFNAPDSQSRFRRTFSSAANIEATFGAGSVGRFSGTWAASQGLNPADVAMGRVQGADRLINWLGDPAEGNARGAMFERGAGIAGGIRESLTRAGLGIDATATNGMAWTDRLNNALVSPILTPARALCGPLDKSRASGWASATWGCLHLWPGNPHTRTICET